MNFPETLRSASLVLSRPTPDDLADLCVMHRDPVVMATLGGVVADEVTAQRLQFHLDHWKKHNFGWWVAREPDTGRFVGRGGVRYFPVEGLDEPEIGYGMMAEFWGRGLAGEIAAAAARAAFECLGLGSVVAFTSETNLRSRRVMEKLGFEFERDIVFMELPQVLYRLRRGDWLARQGREAEYRFTRLDARAVAPSDRDGGGLLVEWAAEEIGFGRLYLYTDKDGALRAHNETMSRAFVVALLSELGRRVRLED